MNVRNWEEKREGVERERRYRERLSERDKGRREGGRECKGRN